MTLSYKKLIPILAVVFAAAVAIADNLADFKKWYKGELPSMVKAMEGKNIGFFEKCSTKDFTYTEFGGKSSDKKVALAGLKQMMDSAQKIKFKPTVGAIKSAKGAMTVEVAEFYEMTMKPGPDKKTHKMTVSSKVRETWVKSGGKWLLKNITDLTQGKMTMDGKPFPG
jgi:hypothetical protein